ncbi:MAG: phosphoribosylformylglycinamidine synthase subunit PurL [Proteobacteria bacterium]|nr:phosphoribosylformylglycinamidine synthase subunit PurL [Pseudomonadota bacterium]
MTTLTNPQKTVKPASPLDKSNSSQFSALLKRHKISADEYQRIEASIERVPTLAELGVFSAMWSEHCSYKSSRVHLKRFPTTGSDVVVGPGENAGVVRLEGKMCLAFKMESHNHPSYIEPYQGAATGVGGILRDVFCMGSRPIANLNCLRFGERSHERTSYLAKRVVKGIGDYGNCIGVPTIGGSVSYDKTYNGNCLVNAMTVGLIRDDKIFKGFASGIGNLVVYVGSATGRDGINGASMASDSFSSQESGERSTVQVGDPYAEKLLLEATLEVLEKDLVVGIQDMGAAGLTSSSFEMAGRAGNGVFFDLDKVPVRAKQMTAYEIMLSESQERMLMVIEPSKWEPLKDVLLRWGLAHAVIGEVTDTGRVICHYQGVEDINLPVAPLTDNAPMYHRLIAERVSRPIESPQLKKLSESLRSNDFAKDTFLKMLRDTGSVEPIFRQYDHHVGTKTVYGPESGGAGVLWIRSEETASLPWLGVLVSAGCNERRVKNRPLVGAADAVLTCSRKIFAAGGKPIAVTDCLNFGSAEDPTVMREFSDSVDGISAACNNLGIPVVSGNVSLYNSTDGESIHPTPMIGVVGKIDDVRRAIPAVAVKTYQLYALSPLTFNGTLVSSLAAKVASLPATEGFLPEQDWKLEKSASELLKEWIDGAKILAARDVSQGGLGLTATKMMLGSHCSQRSAKWVATNDPIFEEVGATYVIELDDKSNYETMNSQAKAKGMRLFQLTEELHMDLLKAQTSDSHLLHLPFGTLSFSEMKSYWCQAHDM